MLRILALLLIAVFVVVDTAPAYAQDDRIHVAQRRTLFDLLFGEPEPAPPPVEQPRQRAPQQERQSSGGGGGGNGGGGGGGGGAPAASLPEPEPEPGVEKAEDATRLVVFGDSLAVELARALERFYAEDPNIVIIEQGVGSSGFVRDDHFDWNTAIAEEIAEDSFDLAVVIIGINDRQELREDGETHAPLTDGWTAAYRARITEFLDQLRAAGKPVIWVGLPPMSGNSYSSAISQISAIQRLAAFSGGAEFVDIYERFLGEDGEYSSHGPDINGQTVRMRRDDGIHFSSAGADKLAFFASQSIRQFYHEGGLSIEVADPLEGTDAAGMLRPPFQGLGQMRLLEVAGAVAPLTPSAGRADDLITAPSQAPQAPAEPFGLEDLVMAPMGRADDFGVGVNPAGVENAGGR